MTRIRTTTPPSGRMRRPKPTPLSSRTSRPRVSPGPNLHHHPQKHRNQQHPPATSAKGKEREGGSSRPPDLARTKAPELPPPSADSPPPERSRTPGRVPAHTVQSANGGAAPVGAAATFTEPVVLDYRNNGWKFQPTAPITGATPAAELPASFSKVRQPAPRDGGGDLKLAGFNVLALVNEHAGAALQFVLQRQGVREDGVCQPVPGKIPTCPAPLAVQFCFNSYVCL